MIARALRAAIEAATLILFFGGAFVALAILTPGA